jgi:hypothetical protein
MILNGPLHCPYEGISKRFRTESITKYMLTFGTTRCYPVQRVIAAELTRLTHKIEIKLYLVPESCSICSSRSRRPVRKLLDTPSYVGWCAIFVIYLIHTTFRELAMRPSSGGWLSFDVVVATGFETGILKALNSYGNH